MKTSAKLAWGFILLLAILHWDFWYWDDRTIVLGFMPIGLFYQAMISVAAAIGWALVIKLAWPSDVERWAEEGSDGQSGGQA
jgi:hypothetical protein